MYYMNAFSTSAMPLNCESARNLPKRGTLGGDNFQCQTCVEAALKAIHFYRSYLNSGFRAYYEMELECLSPL